MNQSQITLKTVINFITNRVILMTVMKILTRYTFIVHTTILNLKWSQCPLKTSGASGQNVVRLAVLDIRLGLGSATKIVKRVPPTTAISVFRSLSPGVVTWETVHSGARGKPGQSAVKLATTAFEADDEIVQALDDISNFMLNNIFKRSIDLTCFATV